MIEPKLVVISRDNEIEEGWRLVSPSTFSIDRNPFYEAPLLSTVRKAITYASRVLLRLSEPCLPGSVLDELKWASKYASIEIEAKDERIIGRYGDLGFAKTTVIPTLETNIIIVDGKEQKAYLIDNGFSEIDYASTNMANPLDRATKVYLFEKDIAYVRNIKSLLKKDIPIAWIVSVPHYSKETLLFAKEEGIQLFVATRIKSAVIVETSERSLFKLAPLSGDQKCLAPIERLSDYGDGLYVPQGFVDVTPCSDIADDSCFFMGTEIIRLDIMPSIDVTNTIEVPLMDDFIEERFDASVVDEHNGYAYEARRVDYHFILIPPKISEDAVESAIYSPIIALEKKWSQAQGINLDRMKNAIKEIYPSGGLLIELINNLSAFTKCLKSMVARCKYHRYYESLQDIWLTLASAEDTVMKECMEIHSSIATAHSGTRFFKFDDEIDGYRATIAEKTALIERGIDVLSNKRRVEILNQKINDLLKMKERFKQSASSSEEKSLQSFSNLCKKLLLGPSSRGDSFQPESIGRVIATNENSKEAKLGALVREYLPAMKSYIFTCLNIIDDLRSIRIPEHNRVVDQNGESYLVIEDEEEFRQTKDIREELHLGCLARR